MIVPTGSLSLRIASSPAAMASTRSGSSVSRSRKAGVAPADFASATSSALAARIADRDARMAVAMAASARFLRAAGASASDARSLARLAADVAHRCVELARAASTALRGAFMALIRLAFSVSYHVRRGPARRLPRVGCPHQSTCLRGTVTETRRNLSKLEDFRSSDAQQGGLSWGYQLSVRPADCRAGSRSAPRM